MSHAEARRRGEENRGACPRTFWTALEQKRMDFVARSRLCAGEDKARLRTMRHERKDAATTREASEAKTPRLGSRRTRQDASMARSEAGERSETAKRRRQATRIGDARRGSARRVSGCERRAAETDFPRCRKVQAWPRSAPPPDGRLSDEPICAGLRPEPNLKMGERSHGRANRPSQRGSTVGPSVAKPRAPGPRRRGGGDRCHRK